VVVGFVIFWVVLALAIVFVAMRGGPRGARESLYTESRVGRVGLQAAIVLVFAFGLIVPGLVLAFNGEHKASVGPGGVHLSVEEQRGRRLFAETCAFCHTLQAASAVGRTGPDLDALIPQAGETFETRKTFVLSAIESGFAGHYGQMPAQLFQGREAREVAAFVAASAGH
jgi:mono/diheme cytochrome c family protein